MTDYERSMTAAWCTLALGLCLIALYAAIREPADIGGGFVLLAGYAATGAGVLMLIAAWIQRRK